MRKKWLVFNETQALCVEAEKDRDRVSTYLIESCSEPVTWSETIDICTLAIPYAEFRNIVFFLPKFDELPIFTNAFLSAGEPDKFIVKCFDGGSGQVGDELYVERSGYDYPRYKAVVRRNGKL